MGDPVTQACAQAVGSAVVPFSDAIKATYRILKRQYDYVRKLERNFSLLENAEQALRDKEQDVTRVIELNVSIMEPTAQAQTWRLKVLAQMDDIMLVKESYNARTQRSYAMCHFLPLRKLGKRVVRQTASITALLGEVPNNENIVIGREAERVESTDSKKIEDLKSLYENVEELLRNLDDPRKKRIGVWGDAGIGKTTILESLIKELENKPDKFDMIIMVNVGKEGSVSTIQQYIAGRLKLNVKGMDTNQVANTISEALAKRKYLLVLDDVFSELNLGDVGIREHHQQGKLVMACRSKYVLQKMDSHDDINVKGLSEEDGRVLFRKLVGPDTFDHPLIRGIAERVAKECGCYPQVIKAMAYRLNGEHKVHVWEGRLSKLRSPTGHLMEEMQDMVNALGSVYDELTEDEKKCLKYGAVFPEGYDMYKDYLIECWKAQNCLTKVETMKKARAEGYTVLEDLIRYCLLDTGKTEEHVKMSLICWMMARRKDKNKLIVVEDEQHPSKEKWEQAQMISLICTNLQDSHLPESPKCMNISTLLLQKNEELKNIPCEFFKQMPQLLVLDLYSTGIASLPSVSNLSNIKALYLNHCPLERLPVEIQKLKNLEVLDIRGTGIRSFPPEVGAMSSLRCLKVSFACCMGNLNYVIGPSQPIPSHLQAGGLSLLEELAVDVDPSDPNCKVLLNQIATGVGEEILHKVAIEIASLTKLTSLCFYFPSLVCFEKFIKKPQSSGPVGRLVDKYRSFQIQVGLLTEHHNRHQLDIAGCSNRRQFRYSAGTDASGALRTSITEVFKHPCSFELIGHKDIQSLSDLGNDALGSLEVCIIEECLGMKTILMGGGNKGVLQHLKKLHLSGLHGLDCIWEGPIVQGSLAKLTTLTLSDCRNIEKILSWEVAKQLLPQLKLLRVENCPRVVEVIEADQASTSSSQTTPAGTSSLAPANPLSPTNHASTSSQAPCTLQLKMELLTLELINLPELVSIYGDKTNQPSTPSPVPHNQPSQTIQSQDPPIDILEWTYLKKLQIRDCANLQDLSLTTTNAPWLKLIECDEGWWRGLNFHDEVLKSKLEACCHFQ
ncbi:hypothetical protein LguiA_002724 [Lonicera macranthoides]